MPDPAHVQWCRNMFDMLREGGVWGVPACGLMWMKRDGQLVLTARMPWTPDMEGTITKAELKEQQNVMYADTLLHFNAAGITVVDSTIEV